MKFTFARLAALSFVVVFGAWAQGTGEITGTVTDATGAAISGAKIRVINTATATGRDVTTNEAGNYDVPALVPGIYDLKAEYSGFRTSERKGVELQVAQVARLDFAMQVGQRQRHGRGLGRSAGSRNRKRHHRHGYRKQAHRRSAAERTQSAATCLPDARRHHQRAGIVSGSAAHGWRAQCLRAECRGPAHVQ